MALRPIQLGSLQNLQVIFHLAQQFCHRQALAPGGGQFDRQRAAVQIAQQFQQIV